MARLHVATKDGLHSLDVGGRVAGSAFVGRPVTAVVRDGTELWAIVDRREIWHEPGDGWRHVASLEGFAAACIAFTDAIHVGSSEAHLFRLDGDTLRRVEGFDEVEGRDGWGTPWGGPPDTRSFSEWGPDVYVNVHVGGIAHTEDGGATWNPTIDVDADVHQVGTAEGVVLAATAGGLAVGRDRGSTWSYRTEGLDARYARAVVVCGDDLLLSTSQGPRGGDAAVYRAPLDEGPFERCREGLPDGFEGNIDTGCLDAANDGSFAAFGTEDGRVFASDDGARRWRELATGLPGIHHLLVVPD
jgi:hypothetical protein